jgi:hypothetical protein
MPDLLSFSETQSAIAVLMGLLNNVDQHVFQASFKKKFFFLFAVLGFELRAYALSSPALFCDEIFFFPP